MAEGSEALELPAMKRVACLILAMAAGMAASDVASSPSQRWTSASIAWSAAGTSFIAPATAVASELDRRPTP